jgi:Spy/CpxP family protein refolding chaperone
MRFSRQGWAMMAVLLIIAMVSQVSLAQREEGRRGRGGPGGGMMSGVRLATLEPVQTALKVTDEQKDKIKTINADLRDGMDKSRDEGGGREKMQELTEDAGKKLNEVLDEGQQKRLMGILVQVAGPAAIADPAIAKELNVTDDQKKKLAEVRETVGKEMRELFQNAGEGGREGMREKMDKLREDSNKKLMAVLTADQQAELEKMKGEKVEIDLSQLRGRGGDRQRGERGERRGDRNPEQNEEKSTN